MAVMRNVNKMKEFVAPKTAAQAREVEFVFQAPNAKRVSVAGQFNNWNTDSQPMKKSKDGAWRATIRLAPGQYEYKFFVDGAWSQDVPTDKRAQNAFGTYNCVISVKAA